MMDFHIVLLDLSYFAVEVFLHVTILASSFLTFALCDALLFYVHTHIMYN